MLFCYCAILFFKVSKNCGTVTLAHFARVLHFLKINVSADEFHLLIKRFIKDSYTVNYVAFVEEIESIVRKLDSKRLIDFSEVNDSVELKPKVNFIFQSFRGE